MRLGLATSFLLFLARPVLADDPPAAPAQPAQEGSANHVSGTADAAAEEPWSLDLTVGDVGLGIGNSKRIIGVRLNYRDRAPYEVYGVNATLWSPPNDATSGTVNGLLLGVPLAVAHDLRGLGLGLGVGAEGDFDGIGVGVVGLGAGERLRGIHLAGLGVGAGGSLDGFGFGLVGVGAGERVRGIAIGGIGVGTGGDATGIVVGGVGAGAGGRIRGLAVGGVGVGAGEGIDGIALALVGVGAPEVRGIAAALAVGGQDLTGIFLAPAYFHVEPEGTFRGVAVSAYSRVLGEQRGLTIGIFNYAASLQGVQLGLLNYAGNNPTGLKLLPVANVHL